MLCIQCNQFARKEYDPGSGNTACSNCGYVRPLPLCSGVRLTVRQQVYEDSQIVSEIAFGETAGGAAIVQGSHVAAGASAFLCLFSMCVLILSSWRKDCRTEW